MNRALLRGGLAALLAGGLPTAIGWAVEPAQASHAYLFAFSTCFSLVAGMLFLVLIGNASNARWFVPLRRFAEDVVAVLPLFLVLLLPILLSLGHLYPWAGDVHALPPAEAHLVEKKLGWLNRPFFTARALSYVVALGAVAEALRRWSRRQDRQDAERLRARMVGFSAVALTVVAFLVSFAAWDWVMSLNPAWFSNVYGVYYFGGGFVAALSLVAWRIARAGAPLGSGHSFAVGRLMLAFTIFWMYIGFAQTMLVWLVDLPDEVTWYLDRWAGGWQGFGVALLVAHFALPFALLLSQPLKMRPRALAGVAAVILPAHVMDHYYLVLPELHPEAFAPHWLDLSALVAVSGACVAFGALRARHGASMPVGDPALAEGLRYKGEPG